jgi:membrane protein required for colicin V production
MDVSVIDLFLGGLLVAGIVRGAQAGAVRQVASLVGVVLAFALAVQFMRPVGAAITDGLGLTPALAPATGFLVVFAVVQGAVALLIRLLEGTLDALQVDAVNRVAGGLVGGFKMALVASVLSLALASFGLPSEPMRAESRLYGPVARVLPATWGAVQPYVPALKRLAAQFEVDGLAGEAGAALSFLLPPEASASEGASAPADTTGE